MGTSSEVFCTFYNYYSSVLLCLYILNGEDKKKKKREKNPKEIKMEPFLQSPLTELSFQPAFPLLPWSYQTTCARHGTTNGSLQFMKCQILKPARVFLFQCQSWGVIVASQDRILTEFFLCLIFFAILVQNYPLCTICRLNIVGQVGNATTINNTDFYSFAQ